MSAILSALKEIPSEINDFRGYFVDKVIEISNLELVKDVAEFVDSFVFTSTAEADND